MDLPCFMCCCFMLVSLVMDLVGDPVVFDAMMLYVGLFDDGFRVCICSVSCYAASGLFIGCLIFGLFFVAFRVVFLHACFFDVGLCFYCYDASGCLL